MCSSTASSSSAYTILHPISPLNLSKLPSIRGRFPCEEGHFSLLVEGVKLLPNPLFFASYLLKLKNCCFSFPSYKSKEDLHFSDYKAFALAGRLFQTATIPRAMPWARSLCDLQPCSMVTIIYIISISPILLSKGLKSPFYRDFLLFCVNIYNKI